MLTYKVWKHKFLSYFLAYTGKYLIKFLFFTCKASIEGLDRFIACASNEKCIIILWHNRLAIIAEILNRYAPLFIYTALISKSRDADPLAILADSYSIGKTIRVPHNARHFALKKLIDCLKNKGEVILITPDGPRGPCYEVKPGIAMAALETNATIIPFSWKADRYWEFKTWDRFMLPKPFSKIHIVFGDPFKIDSLEGEENRSKVLITLSQSLDMQHPF